MTDGKLRTGRPGRPNERRFVEPRLPDPAECMSEDDFEHYLDKKRAAEKRAKKKLPNFGRPRGRPSTKLRNEQLRNEVRFLLEEFAKITAEAVVSWGPIPFSEVESKATLSLPPEAFIGDEACMRLQEYLLVNRPDPEPRLVEGKLSGPLRDDDGVWSVNADEYESIRKKTVLEIACLPGLYDIFLSVAREHLAPRNRRKGIVDTAIAVVAYENNKTFDEMKNIWEEL